MQLMTWNEHFVTGYASIDAQHRHLVDLINGAAPLLVSPGPRSAVQVKPLLNELAHYAVTHFQYEEDMMRQRKIAATHSEHHCHSHAAFAQEVGRMLRQVQDDGNLSGTELLRFLTSWLTFHILSEDMDMARQFRAVEAGMAPEQAASLAGHGDDGANAVLNGALIDLFGLLSQRNRSLAEVNERLRAAQEELATANQTLETRVTERTAELASANAALAREHQAVRDALARLQQTQVQLMQSEKMAAVGQLAAGVAHEINNPVGFVSSNLRTLSGYVRDLLALVDASEPLAATLPANHPLRQQLAQAKAQKDVDYLRQDAVELLRESEEGLARVKRIVGDLMDFSHVDESLWQEADLNQGLESTLNVAWNGIKDKAQVVKDFGELPPVHCIASQINQVFMNLLVNAAQAIEGQGTITLRTGVDGEHVWVDIEDTGKGMSDEVQRRIFEPFFTTKPVGKGTGLGLSISWDIVKRHQGRIEVRSEPGKGSVFRVVLPIHGRNSEQRVGA